MPRLQFDDEAMYGDAIALLLDLENSTFQTAPDQVLFVDQRQYDALAQKHLVPNGQAAKSPNEVCSSE